MRRDSQKKILEVTILLTTFCLSASALRRDRSTDVRLAMKTELENRIVVGFQGNSEFLFIDPTAEGEFRHTSIPVESKNGRILTLKDGEEVQTSDREWIGSCKHKANCTISNRHDPNKKLVLKFKGILTALYWSPDDKFVFYLRNAPAWRLPVRCGF